MSALNLLSISFLGANRNPAVSIPSVTNPVLSDSADVRMDSPLASPVSAPVEGPKVRKCTFNTGLKISFFIGSR